jgi:hypothetical protein
MALAELEKYLNETERVSKLLEPIRGDLLKILTTHGHEYPTHIIDRLRGWGKTCLSLEVVGTYWEDIFSSDLSKDNIHKITRVNRPVQVKINTLPSQGSSNDPDIDIIIRVSGMTANYLLDSDEPENSQSRVFLGENRRIAAGNWESCAEDLPKLIDWLKEKFSQRNQDIIDINEQIEGLDKYVI